MKAHIVLAHPKPQSFNAKLASISNCALISAVYGISFSDLFSQRVRCCWGQQSLQCAKRPTVFSFANRTALQRRKIPAGIRSYRIDQQHQSCNLLNVNFPLWWFGTPANLKGWIDWVFVYGKVYTSTRSFDNGICRGKKRSHASPRAHLQTAVQPLANRGYKNAPVTITFPSQTYRIWCCRAADTPRYWRGCIYRRGRHGRRHCVNICITMGRLY